MRTSIGTAIAVVLLCACRGEKRPSEATPPPGPEPPSDQASTPPAGLTFGLDERPSNITCLARPPPAAPGMALTPAFPNLTFAAPVALVRHRLFAGDDTSWFWLIVEKDGVVHAFRSNDASTSAIFLDLSAHVFTQSENGLLGLALDPDYSAAPGAPTSAVYVSYTGGTDGGLHDCPLNIDGQRLCSFLSRFAVTSTDRGLSFTASAETVLMRVQQPYLIHKAGQLLFGPDGYLYYSLGDGGLAFDPNCAGQNLNTPLAKILRIDVHSLALPYRIPPGNPFAGGPLCNDHLYRFASTRFVDNPDVARDTPCPEIWAYGFRNPWRFTFDRLTGELWVGDVGQDKREEIDRVVVGGNYGWGLREGSLPLPDWAVCTNGRPGLIAPVIEYDHTGGLASVTGGYVYRGTAMPTLAGRYVFADSSAGRIWAVPLASLGAVPLLSPRPLVDGRGFLVSLGEDEHGELYVVDFRGPAGRGVMRLSLTSDIDSSFPQRLSETGCVDPVDPRLPALGLIPYDVASPFWSDGAQKERYLALADNTTIAVLPDGDWDLPDGTVLVKAFTLLGRLLETRLLMRHDAVWAGYTYVWNDQQTEAFLADAHSERPFGTQTWVFPSRAECMACHTGAAGGSIGLETAQQSIEIDYPAGRRADQVRTLTHIGFFAAPPARLAPLPNPLADGPLAARARSYLHANCSFCHRPGGMVGADMDLRYSTLLADTGTCDERPLNAPAVSVADSRLLAPGEPERSLLWLRVAAAHAPLRMPPIGSKVVDQGAAAVIHGWIRGLAGCL